MSQTIEIEVDDIHELMFKELGEDMQEDLDLEEWAEETLESIIYQSYKNRGQPAPQPPQ